jgi:hypothetical protein
MSVLLGLEQKCTRQVEIRDRLISYFNGKKLTNKAQHTMASFQIRQKETSSHCSQNFPFNPDLAYLNPAIFSYLL